MNKKLVLLSAAFSSLFAGSAINQLTIGEQAPDVVGKVESGPRYVSRTFTSQRPAPAQPAAPQAAPRQVAIRPFVPMPSFVHFIEKPHLRKVKYGKHRWVMV